MAILAMKLFNHYYEMSIWNRKIIFNVFSRWRILKLYKIYQFIIKNI
jgi:hypothetical protein